MAGGRGFSRFRQAASPSLPFFFSLGVDRSERADQTHGLERFPKDPSVPELKLLRRPHRFRDPVHMLLEDERAPWRDRVGRRRRSKVGGR